MEYVSPVHPWNYDGTYGFLSFQEDACRELDSAHNVFQKLV